MNFAMRKRMHVLLMALTALSLSAASCSAAFIEDARQEEDESSETSRLKIRISEYGGTRSTISPDENLISDLCVMAYGKEDGRLAAVQTGRSAEEIDIELRSGRYDVFVTANMGAFDAPADVNEIGSIPYTIKSFAQMNEALPMCWKGEADLKPGEDVTISAFLSRLVSRIGLRVETGALKGLDIKSARLCQGAGKIWPFMEGGSRISQPSDAMDGDHSTQMDLQRLMDGETVYFYAAENCQGTLLPDNTDPWAKTPENIGEAARLCTYMEMTAEWNGSASYEGSVTYRFYLGEDSATDFNIRRNSQYNLTLYLEEESLGKVNWKIDASQTSPLHWEMASTLENNFHDRENFYVTENIRVDFTFDEKGRLYWANRKFSLDGIGNGGKTVIRFSDPVDLGGGKFYAIGTCIGPGYYDIVLKNDETGEIVYYMEYGDIHVPEIMVGPPGSYSDTRVEGFKSEKEMFINKGKAEVCLYLVDRDGYNLNQGDYYGCDLSVPDWSLRVLTAGYGHDIGKGMRKEAETGEAGSDSYAIRYLLSVENDGKDEVWNSKLTSSLGRNMLELTFEDRNSGASGETTMSLYCEDISITFKPVPDKMKSELQSEFMYVVDNSSNLPVNIRGLKLNSMSGIPLHSKVSAVLCRPIPGFTSDIPLLVSRMPYTLCSLEPDAARSEMVDGRMCYAADTYDIEQSQIPMQTAMFHSLEADFAYRANSWRPSFTGAIDLYDTSEHRLRYGSNGYMNCGMAFHTPVGSHLYLDSNNGTVTDFEEYGSLLEKHYIKQFDEIIEVQIGINENNEIVATSSRKADIRISVSGNVKGHIRCVTVQDPFYTLWGHYFTESFSFNHSLTLNLGKDPVVIDGGSLAGAFTAMRSSPYYSVVDALKVEEFRVDDHQYGTIREYLKPYGIDLSVSISALDRTPVAVRFSGSAIYDYKTSEPVTWATGFLSTATMVPSSHSEFDKGLDEHGCPPGALFKEETLYLQPDVTLQTTQNLYYMTR
jgi:hypothetical protein